MGRPKLDMRVKVLRGLEADLERLQKDLEGTPTSPAWEAYRASVEAAISRKESAIRSVTDNGLPEGWAEKWGVN